MLVLAVCLAVASATPAAKAAPKATPAPAATNQPAPKTTPPPAAPPPAQPTPAAAAPTPPAAAAAPAQKTPGLAVVLSKRAGVAPADALAWAEAVRAHVTAAGFTAGAAVNDLSSCQAKVACLTEKWTFRPETVWLAVEVGDLIDEKLVAVKLLQKGNEATPKLTAKAQGTDATLPALLQAQLAPVLKALEDAGLPRAAPKPTVAEEPKPEPKVVAPPPTPVKREPPAWSRLWWAPAVGGVACAGAGVGLLLSAYADSDRLRSASGLQLSEAQQLRDGGALKQGLAMGLFGLGGAAVVAAAVMLVTQLSAPVALIPTRDGWLVALGAPL